MFPAGTKPKVIAGNNKITRLYPGSKGRVGIFQNMFGQLGEIAPQMSQPPRNDMVGRNTITKLEGSALKHLHHLSGVSNPAGNGGSRRRSRASQIDEGLRIAHSSPEISISRGQAGLSIPERSLMETEASPTPRGQDNSPGLNQRLDIAGLNSRQENLP
jgi:hypothetical protein